MATCMSACAAQLWRALALKPCVYVQNTHSPAHAGFSIATCDGSCDIPGHARPNLHSTCPFKSLCTALVMPLTSSNTRVLQAPDSVLKWQYRWPRIRAVLQALDTDVLCLQEVNHYHECFEPVLRELGYEGTSLLQ